MMLLSGNPLACQMWQPLTADWTAGACVGAGTALLSGISAIRLLATKPRNL